VQKDGYILITKAKAQEDKNCGSCTHFRTTGQKFWSTYENVLKVATRSCTYNGKKLHH